MRSYPIPQIWKNTVFSRPMKRDAFGSEQTKTGSIGQRIFPLPYMRPYPNTDSREIFPYMQSTVIRSAIGSL